MWPRITSLVIGAWLVAAPSLFDLEKEISDNGHISGSVIMIFSTISLWGCMRNVLLLNVPVGVWLLFSAWIIAHPGKLAFASFYFSGLIVIVISTLLDPKPKDRFSGGWCSLIK